MRYALLFISTILMTSSLNAMEIIKKRKNQKKYKQHSQTLKRYLLIQKICQRDNAPEEIGHYIIQYYIALSNNDLLERLNLNLNRFMVLWDDAHIPINYYHLLTNTQLVLMSEILSYRPPCLQHYSKRKKYKLYKRGLYEGDYFLQSEKDYQLFLTLPIELRKCLAQAPKSLIDSAIELQENPLYKDIPIPTVINASQVIQVKSESTLIKHDLLQKINVPIHANYPGYIPRLIVPEEKQLSLK
jgi:hypothetical protein